MVAGHRHGDLRGRAMESRRNVRQEPYAITAHGPRKVWVESWKHGLPRCSGKGATECNICLPRHRPPFPHAQHEPLIPSPQNPADRNAARDRKRKYVICRAVLRKPTWTRGEKKNAWKPWQHSFWPGLTVSPYLPAPTPSPGSDTTPDKAKCSFALLPKISSPSHGVVSVRPLKLGLFCTP